MRSTIEKKELIVIKMKFGPFQWTEYKDVNEEEFTPHKQMKIGLYIGFIFGIFGFLILSLIFKIIGWE